MYLQDTIIDRLVKIFPISLTFLKIQNSKLLHEFKDFSEELTNLDSLEREFKLFVLSKNNQNAQLSEILGLEFEKIKLVKSLQNNREHKDSEYKNFIENLSNLKFKHISELSFSLNTSSIQLLECKWDWPILDRPEDKLRLICNQILNSPESINYFCLQCVSYMDSIIVSTILLNKIEYYILQIVNDEEFLSFNEIFKNLIDLFENINQKEIEILKGKINIMLVKLTSRNILLSTAII